MLRWEALLFFDAAVFLAAVGALAPTLDALEAAACLPLDWLTEPLWDFCGTTLVLDADSILSAFALEGDLDLDGLMEEFYCPARVCEADAFLAPRDLER